MTDGIQSKKYLLTILRRFLNSVGFIGYAKDVYELVTAEDLEDTDDDQRYYTKLFLEERDKRGIKLDTKTKIFANLNHAICKQSSVRNYRMTLW